MLPKSVVEGLRTLISMRTNALKLPKSGPIMLPKSVVEVLRTLIGMRTHALKLSGTQPALPNPQRKNSYRPEHRFVKVDMPNLRSEEK